MAKVIAIVNQKGGVGKTTTAVNLSACLAERGKQTLLIDIDPQGNATSGIGIDKFKVKKSIYDVLINGSEIEDTLISTKTKNLFLCPSSVQLSGAEIELVPFEKREYRLKATLRRVLHLFDFVIIDCPPAMGLLILNAIVAADTVLIPIQCEYYALEGLSSLTNTLKYVKKGLNTSLEIEGVLLTMFDARTNLSIQVVEEVKKFFPKKVYSTIIPRNVRLSEAPSFGKPIIEYDSHSRGAETYRELAEEVIYSNSEVI